MVRERLKGIQLSKHEIAIMFTTTAISSFFVDIHDDAN